VRVHAVIDRFSEVLDLAVEVLMENRPPDPSKLFPT
jgi:hypothetical protein